MYQSTTDSALPVVQVPGMRSQPFPDGSVPHCTTKCAGGVSAVVYGRCAPCTGLLSPGL